MTGLEIIVLLIYSIIFLAIAKFFSSARFGKERGRKYLVRAVLFKIVCVIAFVSVYKFYYGYGDTFGYYNMGMFIRRIMEEAPFETTRIFFDGSREYYQTLAVNYGWSSWYALLPKSMFVAKHVAILSFISFESFWVCSLLFGMLGFFGAWRLYLLFFKLAPSFEKHLMVGFLFLPSFVFWSAGVLKEPLSFFYLSFLCTGLAGVLFLRRFTLYNFLAIYIGFSLSFSIKAYIPLIFIACLLLWFILNLKDQIQIKIVRRLTTPFLLLLGGISFFAIASSLKEELGSYALENAMETATTIQGSITRYSEASGGSTYDLGTIDPSVSGILSKFPIATITGLYRPFIFEATKVIMLFSALEVQLFLFLTLVIIFKLGFRRIWVVMSNNNIYFFFLTVSIIFAFTTGLTSGNFGTLVRYRIPFLPFFYAFLMALYGYTRQNKKRTIRDRRSKSLPQLPASPISS